MMGIMALADYWGNDPKQEAMEAFLSSEGSYWLMEDVWNTESQEFKDSGLKLGRTRLGSLKCSFTSFDNDHMKLEMKFFLLHEMKMGHYTAGSIFRSHSRNIWWIGELIGSGRQDTFNGLEEDDSKLAGTGMSEAGIRQYRNLRHQVILFITDFYDDRAEIEKDIWHARMIPGVKMSAAAYSQKKTMNFAEIPEYYKPSVKRFFSRLIFRRSWSYCTELLIYIRYFYRAFYGGGYKDGFQEGLSRADIERYLGWVAADYRKDNATFRSKAVSAIRSWLDYIQLAEYSDAPRKDVIRLIFDDDVPRRERAGDTLEKVRYIPVPVKELLDAHIHEIEPQEMLPVYILLRETGWRGTDVLDLRYDNCLEYVWNAKEEAYISYLCGEITKTGIPLHKIPIREKVANMVKAVVDETIRRSTPDNNPEKYLFNTYDGLNKGLPYSKPAFTDAVQTVIDQNKITDGDGRAFHFKAHSLRHTRAMEYTEQGMSIGIIQQILGHCSLQMTLHYSKVSEDMLYQKWKETETLELLHLDVERPGERDGKTAGIRYEYIRKNLDAVKVPFGICFNPAKIPCRQQMRHCLECASFCTDMVNIEEYEAEIGRVEKQIEISVKYERDEWENKNQKYLKLLISMLERIKKGGTVHKNSSSREEFDGR